MSTYPRWSASDLLADAALSWRRGLGGATLLNHYVLGFSFCVRVCPLFNNLITCLTALDTPSDHPIAQH